ncbi:MAG TPA: ABC transporter permease [Vicinamibacterales bacterium]
MATISQSTPWSEIPRDLRHAVRVLLRSPGFTLTAVLSLALGIGATTAIFSVVHAVVIDPFPYRNPETLVSMAAVGPRGGGNWSTYTIDEYVELAERATVFEAVIASTIADVALTGTGVPERLRGNYVSMNTFDVMGVGPLYGRTPTAADARADAPPVAVLGYRFWQRQFGGDPGVIGRTLRLNGVLREVIGVMPRRFMWRGADVYLPTRYERGLQLPGVRTVHVMGRLREGMPAAQVEASVHAIVRDFQARAPARYPESFRIELQDFGETFASDLGDTLLILLGAVGLLLLIACANVSNLQLARATAREREMALRATLGAGRWRLIRQLLTESALLALIGGLLGVALAQAGLWAVTAVIPPDTIPDESHVRLNAPVLLFSLVLASLSTLLFGLTPAWQLARTDAAQMLRDGGRSSTAGARHARLRNVLVVSELALSMVLLVGAGLMMRTLVGLQQAELTFEPERMLTMRVPLAEARYPTAEARARFLRALIDRVESLPGVKAAAVDSGLPFLGARGTTVTIPGRPPLELHSLVHETSEHYLDLQRARLIAGRALERADIDAVRRVAVVNRAFVERFLGGASPLGQTVRLDYLSRPPLNAADDSFEIVGVIDDLRNRGVPRETWPEIYVPFGVNSNVSYFVVEGLVPPQRLERAVRGEVYALDPEQPVTDVATLAAVIDETMFARPRFSLILLGAFSAVGLLLALLGVYGIMAYSVARQRTELGVRMALGATAGDVLRLVMGRGLRLVAAGAGVGTVLALWAKRVLSAHVWGVSTRDAMAYAAVALVLGGAGLVACFIPAFRAARSSPMTALRTD